MLNYKIHYNNSTHWVVFLHGIGGSTATWKKQIDAFQQYNLLLIDLPGHGESKCEQKITISNVNESIKEVLDHVQITKADFVTLSLGTLVAAHFAIKYPQYVGSIIFGGAVIKVDGIYKCLMNTVQAIKRFLPHRLLFNIMAKIMLPKRNHKKSRKIFIRESLKMTRKNFLSWISYIAEITHSEQLIQKLKELRVKMFFISGDEDRCFLDGTKRVVAYLSKPKLYIIKKCGHVCSIEKSGEFNTKALDFLDCCHKPKLASAV